MKLKGMLILLVMSALLAGCTTKEEKFLTEIVNKTDKQQESIDTIQLLNQEQLTVMELMDETLKVGSKEFSETAELVEDGGLKSAQISKILQEERSALTINEKELDRLEKMLGKLEKSEYYAELTELLAIFKAYESDLGIYLEESQLLMDQYTTFFQEVSGDVSFKTLEELIGTINLQLEETKDSYETYRDSALVYHRLIVKELSK